MRVYWVLLVGLVVAQGCSIFGDDSALPEDAPSDNQPVAVQPVEPDLPPPPIERAVDELPPRVEEGEGVGSGGHEDLLDP